MAVFPTWSETPCGAFLRWHDDCLTLLPTSPVLIPRLEEVGHHLPRDWARLKQIELQTVEQRIVTVLVLAGMSAGGVPILAAVRHASVAYLVTIAVPAAAAFAYQGTALSMVLALMMLVFLAGMITTTWIAHRSVMQSLHLRRENQRLLAQAMEDNARLQSAIEQRKQAEQALLETNRTLEERVRARTAELERRANHDPLTQLPNRLLLQDRLEQALRWAQRNGGHLAVLFLDLDRFKLINDSLGHDAGDQLLKEVATRLQSCLRQTDTIARLGGDEFVIVLEGLGSASEAMLVARKVLAILAPPITIQEQEVTVSASIGISHYPQDGADIKALLIHADGDCSGPRSKDAMMSVPTVLRRNKAIGIIPA